MLKLLLISFLIFINIPSFADNTDIITYLDKRESQALQLEDNLTKTEETLIENLNQSDLAISYFEADSADKLGDELNSNISYDKILSRYTPILNNPGLPKEERLKALKKIAEIKLRQEEYLDIIQICQGLLNEYPKCLPLLETEAEAYHLYANHYITRKEYDNAITQYAAILKLNDIPEEWRAFSKDYIAGLYLIKGEDDKALLWFNRIIQDHPNLKHWPASAHFRLGQYYLKRKDIQKAKEEFNVILTKHPNSNWVSSAKSELEAIK